MKTKLSYYPGCTLKNHARNFDDSTVAALEKLDFEVAELDNWNCCGTVHGLASDDLMHRMAPVTNLIRVKEAGAKSFMTSCAMCYNTLKRANQELHSDTESLKIINDFLSLESTKYNGEVEVLHLLEILREQVGFAKLASKLQKRLTGLRVACYYGCLLTRPKSVAFTDVENPTIMEELVGALGATAVPFPFKTECCGAYHTVDQPAIIGDRTDRIIGSAQESKADVVIVSCPLCAHNLDQRQEEAKLLNPRFRSLPVLYFTQLLAIALGCPESSLRLELHHIDPRPLLVNRGLLAAESRA